MDFKMPNMPKGMKPFCSGLGALAGSLLLSRAGSIHEDIVLTVRRALEEKTLKSRRSKKC